MTDQSAIRKFLFSKAMPNGDIFYYEEEFLMDMLTGVEQSVVVKLVGVRKQGRGPILALSSSAVNNEFDELTLIGTPRQLPLSSRSELTISADRALSSELSTPLSLSDYEPRVRYQLARHGKVLEVDPYYPEIWEHQAEPTLQEINIGVKERADSFASTVDDYGCSQHCFDITASASSSLLSARDKHMLLRPRQSQSALWDDHGLDPKRRRAIRYDEYFEQSTEIPAWVYRTLEPDEQFRPELVELDPFGAPPLRAKLMQLPLNAQANSVVTPGATAANSDVSDQQPQAQLAVTAAAPEAASIDSSVYEATGTTDSFQYSQDLAAFTGYSNYAQYYTKEGHGSGLEGLTSSPTRTERLTGQDSRQRYNSYSNPALKGDAAFKDFSTPQDRARSDFKPAKKTSAAPSAEQADKTARARRPSGVPNEFSTNTMVSSSVNGVYQRQTQATVLRPQLIHPELYERNTITTHKPGRTGPLAGSQPRHSADAYRALGTYNSGYETHGTSALEASTLEGSTLAGGTLGGASHYGYGDYAGNYAPNFSGSFDAVNGATVTAPSAAATSGASAAPARAVTWHEALVAARAGVPTATLTPDYVAALKGARSAQLTQPRRYHSLSHLHLPAVNAYMPEDPHYVPTDSAIAFADRHAAYHQAYSHGASVSRYAYGADFADDAGKARQAQLKQERAHAQNPHAAATAANAATAAAESRANSGFTTASEYYHRGASSWWRDSGLTEQSAQEAFSEESFHQGKHGAFIGTPEEFIPEEQAPQVSTVPAQLVTTSDTTIVTAPAPEATIITGERQLGNQAAELYQSEPETVPNAHTRIIYQNPREAHGLSTNGDEQAAAVEAQRAQDSFNDLGAVHHHPSAWSSAAQTKTAYFEDIIPNQSAHGDFADFSTADERRQRALKQEVAAVTPVVEARNNYDHSEQDPTYRTPKRLKNPQLPTNAVDVAAQARTSSQAQGFKPAPAVAAEVPPRPSDLEPEPQLPEPPLPQLPPSPETKVRLAAPLDLASYRAHTGNSAYAAAAVQSARALQTSAATPAAAPSSEYYGTYGHKAQYGDFDAYEGEHTVSAAMVKGYAQPAQALSAYTAISAGSGTGAYEPAHQGTDFSDFATADGSKVEGTIKIPVTSLKQAQAQRQAASAHASELASQDESQGKSQAALAPAPEAAQDASAPKAEAGTKLEPELETELVVTPVAAAAPATEAEAETAAVATVEAKSEVAAASAEAKSEVKADSAPATPAKPPVSAAMQALAANLVATAAQEIDAEEQAAAQAAAAEARAAEAKSSADSAPKAAASMSKAQLKRAKRRAKSRSRSNGNGNGSEAKAPAPERTDIASVSAASAPAVTAAAATAITAAQSVPETKAVPAAAEQVPPTKAPASDVTPSASAAEIAAREAQAQADADYVGGIVLSPETATPAAPTVNAELMVQAEQYLKSRASESMDLGTARDEAQVLAPSELTANDQLQELFAGVTPEDDDDVALDGLPEEQLNTTEPFGAEVDLGLQEHAPSPMPTSVSTEPETIPAAPQAPAAAPTPAASKDERPTESSAEPGRVSNQFDYAVNPVTGSLSERKSNLLEGGFNEHTVVVKAEYSLESLDELHQLFTDPKPMPSTDAHATGFTNDAYQPIDNAAEQATKPRAEAEAEEQARREQEERERLEREAADKARAEAEAAEQARREHAERERLEREAADKARAEAETAEQARREQAERERLEREAAEQARAEAEAAEQARREQAERERLEREAAEKARAEAEAAEQARREQAERERLEREAAEKARAEAEAAEQARREQAEREQEKRERLEREAADKARAEVEAAEQARREQAEREQEERERLEREAADKAQAEAEAAEQARRAQAERERLEREAVAQAAAEALEHGRHEQEERKAQAAAATSSETATKDNSAAEDKSASMPENVLFATPQRFVASGSGAPAERLNARAESTSTPVNPAQAVQAAVAGVIADAASSGSDLLKGSEDDFGFDDAAFSGGSESGTLEKARSSSSSLASLAAELIDDFDDPFSAEFDSDLDEDEDKR